MMQNKKVRTYFGNGFYEPTKKVVEKSSTISKIESKAPDLGLQNLFAHLDNAARGLTGVQGLDFSQHQLAQRAQARFGSIQQRGQIRGRLGMPGDLGGIIGSSLLP